MTTCGKRKWDEHTDVFYTKRPVVDACVATLLATIDTPVSSIVDFSAGDGYFIQAWRRARGAGASDVVRQFDTAPRDAAVTAADWFTVEPFAVDVVGFNPPFGYKSKLIKRFLAHAAAFEPTYMAFIMPRCSWNLLPDGYGVVYATNLDDVSFYTPEPPKDTSVKGCSFVVARRGATTPTPGTRAAADVERSLPPGTRRIPYSRPWPDDMQCGYAVRRVGANAARFVYLVHSRTRYTQLTDDGREIERPTFTSDAGEQLSPISFHTYVTETPPSIEFGRRLVVELAAVRVAHMTGRQVPCVSAAVISRCIERAASAN